MSVEPPSSGRPTGPPSGPLSGSSQPPSGPPSPPPGGGPPGPGPGPEPGPQRPWWRSVPRVAAITAAVVAAVIIAVVVTRPGGGGGSDSASDDGEVFLTAAGKSGPDPFTESTAEDSSAPPATPSPKTTESTPANTVRGVNGGAPGLYGGTRDTASCDVEKQVRYLQDDPEKNRAFASVAGVEPSEVPAYLRSLTPVQLRMDTRVTNHGYRDGKATSYQAVLQAGTAVLVNDRGLPRVRCACGNPLTDPVEQRTAPKPIGDSWPSYRSSNVVVVEPAPEPVKVFKLYDDERDDWFGRHRGDTGGKDHETKPPKGSPTPSTTPTTPTAPQTTTNEPESPGTTPGEPTSPGTSPEPPPPDTDTTTTSAPAPESPGTPDDPGTPTSAEPGV
ncbi:DUF6777 domain-containing protein [Streptomyces sp. NPDC057877]|uniref:DUF6777 domain-containing protein n=1 Tax=Streptomyces sp. NPDC057877 TaxID=3346269 RepID=UPI0036A5FBE0